jgi:methyltransferase
MIESPHGPVPFAALALFLVVLALQRGAELIHSARNTRRLMARGAREFGAGHFPWMVVVHVLFPILLVVEVLALGARPGKAWPFWLAFWLAAQALRYAAVRALGDRWSVRIVVPPGEPLIRLGPYRFLRHPNYLAVAVELIAAPMMFGAWRTAIVISFLDALVLRTRIRSEEAALRGEPGEPQVSPEPAGDRPH